MTEADGFPQPDTPAPAVVAAAEEPPGVSSEVEPSPGSDPAPPLELPHGTPQWLADLLQSFHERLHDLGG